MSNDKPICFVIMPISDAHGYDSGHFGRVYEHLIKPAIIEAGYHPVRADDTSKTDYIVIGIIRQIVECAMVVCDFSAKNPNVMYELGVRHAFNKPVVLIKDKKTEKIFDIQGLRYYEYDESLRIDTVQKDIVKISAAIKDTANPGENSFNSVVQLAGIQAAEVPAGQKVSADTQLILTSLSNLEKRLDIVDVRSRSVEKYFIIEEDKVLFEDNSEGWIGDPIFDSRGRNLGKMVDIHPKDDKIFLRQDDGKIIPYYAYSTRSKGLYALPF